MKGRGNARNVPQRCQLRRRVPREAVIERTAEAFGVDRSSWAPGRRSGDIGGAVAAELACRLCHATKRQIAGSLGYKSQSSLTPAQARAVTARQSASIRRKVSLLEKRLPKH